MSGATGRRTPPTTPVLNAHKESFRRLVRSAQLQLERRRPERAAGLASVAAEFAWRHHPGLFTSQDLEELLFRISETISGRAPSYRHTLQVQIRPLRVLHVLSDSYDAGGHTRLATQWMSIDSSRTHSVAFTRPQTRVPEDLRNAAEGSGGSIIQLCPDGQGLLKTAEALADVAYNYDVIVLHIHPSDVVPNLALSALPSRPTVLFCNHADHVFWLGVRASDMVVCFRPSGHVLAQARRGIPTRRLFDLPLPVRMPARRLSREAAKVALSIPRDKILLLTVASGYKFRSSTRPDMLDSVTQVLRDVPEATLIAIGPTQTGRWRLMAHETKGAVRALGVIPDPLLYREAADVYLDSAPFSSNTSLLESAVLGTAALSYTPNRRADSATQCDLPGLEPGLVRADCPQDYRETLERLIVDGVYRSKVGSELQSTVVELYDHRRWSQSVATLYSAAGRVTNSSQATDDLAEYHTTMSEIDREVLEIGLSRHRPLAVAEAFVNSRDWNARMRWAQLVGLQVLRIDRRISSPTSRLLGDVPARWWPILDRLLIR